MKKIFYCSLLLALLPTLLFAQLFTTVTSGPVVSTGGDSRSVNFVDVNNDGWDDLFITNGPEDGDFNFLYLNNGDGTFTEVTGDEIVMTSAPFDGATFADFDNDGDEDAYAVTWWGKKNHFYRNNGNGTFTEDILIAPAVPLTYSETASWGDADNDGYVDLYVTNSGGTLKNLFYHNNGDGTFDKIITGDAVNDASTSRGITWIDYDVDGDADLYVANENSEPNDMYTNNGDGTFTKITAGPQVSDTRSTMSGSWGDIDNDGDPDLFTANSGNFTGQKNQLFRNNGDGTFTEIITGDATNDSGCSFGSSFEDYDNDGDLDLAVSNGFCNGNILNFLYQNDGAGNFTRDLSSILDLTTPCSYGCAFGDVNNDGFPDLVFATCNNNTGSEPNDIFYMNNGNGNHWIKLKLEGTTSNRSAIGAKVKVKATINGSAVWQYREVTTQSGYCGQNSRYVHFGLGDAGVADSVLVIFPDGNDTVITNVSAGQQLYVLEEGITAVHDPVAVKMMQCFPIPARNNFTIELTSDRTELVKFKLLTAAGLIADEKTVTVVPGKNILPWKIDSINALSGLYLLQANGEGWKAVTKISVYQD